MLAADNENIQKFIHDPALQQKQRQNGPHDDKSATELLNLMPQAFVWKVESRDAGHDYAARTADPNFDPPDMEARVMGSMTGTMIVDRARHRIRTFKGRLQNDVTIGFGLLARIKAGSTFDIERRRLRRECGRLRSRMCTSAGTRCSSIPSGTGGRGEVGLHAGAAGNDAGTGGGHAGAAGEAGSRTGKTAQVIRARYALS